MIIAIASDHAGFKLKKELVELLSNEYRVIDFGTFSEESCDYTDYAKKVALAIVRKDAEKGILLCGSGEGMCIVANKFKGIIAGLCYNEETARLLSLHNYANIICFPARVKIDGKDITSNLLYKWTSIWLNTENSQEERHKRRILKIKEIEEENFK